MKFDTSMALANYQSAKFNAKGQNLNQIKGDSRVDSEDKRLREQTDNFEALILKIMLQDAIKNDDVLYPKQPGSDIYHSMYVDQLSEELSGSFGYSELLFHFLKEQQNLGKVKVHPLNKKVQSAYGNAK